MSQLEASRVETPTSAGEVSSVLRDAASLDQTIAISGGNTRATFGNVGSPADLNLSLSNLNQIIDYSPEDLVIAVEAGCTIRQLNRTLAEHNQFIPLDVAHPAVATIGGAFASGIGGPKRHLHGALKDFVIGVEAVLADGTAVKSGGMVVKNVSGYDMSRLYYGSLGAFGVLTRLNLKVFPRPESCREVIAVTEDIEKAFQLAQQIVSSGMLVGSLYLGWDEDRWSVHIWHYGSSQATASLSQRSRDFAETAQLPSQSIDHEVDEANSFIDAIDSRAGSAIARIEVPFEGQLSACKSLIEAGSSHVFADPFGGLVYGVALPNLTWREEIRHRFERPVFLSLPAEDRQEIDVFSGLAAPVASLVRRLKDEFDPQRRLNPGRYVLRL